MATLAIITSFDLNSLGLDLIGKQGPVSGAGSLITDAIDLGLIAAGGLSGLCHNMRGTLASAAIVNVFSSTNNKPATWIYAFAWVDQIAYVQVVGSATNFTLKMFPKVPQVFSQGSILAAASTTAITGGAEPAVTAVTSVNLGNYSGATLNYLVAFIL